MRIAAPLIATAAAIAFTTANAQAATTVGSDLARPGNATGYCTGDMPGARCTVLQLSLGTADQAVPANGVITRWAVRDARGELTLKVIEGPAGQRHTVASSAPVTATPSGVQSFAAQIPVKAGQRVGVEIGEEAAVPFAYRDEITTGEQYDGSLGTTPSAPRPGAELERTYEMLYNATIEPDADLDGLGDETQDPDHGGTRPATPPPPPAPAGTSNTPSTPGGGDTSGGGGCTSSGVIARGAGSVLYRRGNRVSACRDGLSTFVGTRSRRVRFRLARFSDDKVALVRVKDGLSAVQAFNLSTGRRIFSSSRTYNNGRVASWTVSDLVIAPSGNAAWISSARGAPALTTVWVRNSGRVRQIDQGRIAPTSLTLTDDAAGVDYRGPGGQSRNSSF